MSAAPPAGGAPARARRLGVLGTLVWDRIHHPARGEVLEQWGGITYSLSALAACAPQGWVVEPIVKVGEDLAAEAEGFLARLPGRAAEAELRRVPEPTDRVELTYHDHAHRGERLTGGVPSWRWDELEPRLAGLDALYLNFISGFELELETARRLREHFRGPIYADLHSLFLGCPGSGVRRQRVPPRWEEWLACFDAVQLNQAELALLAGESGPDAFSARLLKMGPSLVAVTLGARGVRIEAVAGRFLPDLPDHLSLVVPVEGGAVEGDPTGCGDVWGSAFVAALLGGDGPEAAARQANALARRKILFPRTEDLHLHLRDLPVTHPHV